MLPYDNRLGQLARMGWSATKIAGQLRLEGHDVSASTVGRRLQGLRGPQRVRSQSRATPPWSAPLRAPQAQEPPFTSPVANAEPLAVGYVPDDEAIDAHQAALAEFIDLRVDAAVVKELGDAQTLFDRLDNVGAAAAWRRCSTCGCRVPPKDGAS